MLICTQTRADYIEYIITCHAQNTALSNDKHKLALMRYSSAMFSSKILWISVMASAALVASISADNALASVGWGTMAPATGNTTDVEFLSIQNAQSGSLSQINATAYTLELNNVSNKTIMFSDRPERIVESASTSDFIGNWSTGVNSFATDAPNDALIVENTQTGQLETAIIESFDPVYDIATNSLTYTIMTDNATSIGLPREFGQALLVIDAVVTLDGGNSW